MTGFRSKLQIHLNTWTTSHCACKISLKACWINCYWMTAYLRYLRVWTDFSGSNSFYKAKKKIQRKVTSLNSTEVLIKKRPSLQRVLVVKAKVKWKYEKKAIFTNSCMLFEVIIMDSNWGRLCSRSSEIRLKRNRLKIGNQNARRLLSLDT